MERSIVIMHLFFVNHLNTIFCSCCLQQPSKTRATSAEQKRLSKLPPRLAKQREQTLKEKKQKTIAIPIVCPTTRAEIPSLFATTVTMSAGGDGNNTFQIENWDNEMANNIPLVSNGEHQPVNSQAAQQQTSKCRRQNFLYLMTSVILPFYY